MASTRKRITETITRGPYAGGADLLSHTPVLYVHTVRQGVANFLDYKLIGDTIDWSPIGVEPSPGSTYTVNYDYVEDV